jgi:diguanylate cyclase (GGDEF)-like protein
LLAKGDLIKAELTMEECLAQGRRINSEHIEMEAMVNLGRVFQKQGRIEHAIKHFTGALNLAEERKANLYQYKYHEVLAELYEEKGDLAASLNHYKAFHAAMELDLASATSYRMENLRIMHEVEKKRKAAEILWLNNRTLEREIDDRRRVHAELELLATADPLTGLFNRRHFYTLGKYELGKACLEETPLSMIMLDIDHFKQVNDNYGHATGDLVLVEISKLIVGNARKGDVCFRYGGEEFVVLLPNTRLEYALEVAERIRNVLSGLPIQIENDEIKVTASLGVAQAELKDNNLANVIDKADQALYRAKAIGRNQISV